MPTLLTGAAACTVGLWFYLSESDVEISSRYSRPPPARVTTPAGHAARASRSPSREPVAAVSSPSRPAAATNRLRDTTLRARITSRVGRTQRLLNDLARNLDQEAVRIRNNLARDPGCLTFAGWLFYHGGDPDAADRCFEQALAVAPGNMGALAAQAFVHLESGNVNRAVAAFQRLCEARPDDAGARYNLGVLLTRMNRFGEAAIEYRRALTVDPLHARSLYNLASLAQREGRLAEARDLWERFLRIEPNVISVWFNLGVVYMDYREPLAAAHCFEAAAAINPDEVVNHLNHAMALMDADHFEAAAAVLERTRGEDPCNPALLDILADNNRRLADWYPGRRYDFIRRVAEIESTIAEINAGSRSNHSRVAGFGHETDALGITPP